MTSMRTGRLAGLALVGALGLAACGSDGAPAPAAGGAGGAGGDLACSTGSVTGAGSSAQKNAMDEWVKTYQQACPGATINYQSVGSSSGRQQFLAGTVDFAGSDSALKPDEQAAADARCGTGKALNLPMVVGPIGIAYNLQGVDDLVLDAAAIAKIFSGQITTWDDPALTALNPDASLPSTPIQQFHRSDGSGTTDNLTKYLEAAAPQAWTFASGSDWKAPGGQGAKGNEGVSAGVKGAEGSIGYLELSFIENGGLNAARLASGDGEPVELTAESAGKAVEAAELKGTGNDLTLALDYATKDAGVYPIVLVSYEIVCEKGTAPDKIALIQDFLSYTASDEGQNAIEGLGYAPLPRGFIEKVRSSVEALG